MTAAPIMTDRPAPAADPRPPSYASRADAMEYVRAVTERTAVLSAGLPPPGLTALAVYVIAAPADRESDDWPLTAARLSALLPGVRLTSWDSAPLAHGITGPAERAAALAALHRGAVVIPHRIGASAHRRVIGKAAQGEARAFVALGRPVLVYTGRRLVAWPDVRRRPAPFPRPSYFPVEVDVPAEPPAPLPTLAASMRALGLGAAEIARASAGLPERGQSRRAGP